MRSMAQRHAATNVTPLPESAATMAATHTRTSRQQRARDLLPWLLALLALGATLYLGGRDAAADPGVHTLRQAQMAPGDAAAEAAWRPVDLPETWARHGLGRTGSSTSASAAPAPDPLANVAHGPPPVLGHHSARVR